MRLGEADAQIMTPISIYSDGGRIENIDVQVNDSVSAGSTLFTLEEGQEQSAYLQLLSQREQLAKVMSDAAALVDDPYVTADATASFQLSILRKALPLSMFNNPVQAQARLLQELIP